MARIIMQPEMVYLYPIWAVGVSMAAAAIAGSLVLELVVRRFVPQRVRRGHNVLTASIFSIVGVTYAVLLAFVAMLAWEEFNGAKAASGHEATLLLDVERTASGLAEPGRTALHDTLVAYARAVIETEWPGQAQGHATRAAERPLDEAVAIAVALQPASLGQGNIQAAVLAELDRLRGARDERLAAAETSIPDIVWFVVVAGGAISMVFAALLGTSSLRLHLLLASLLAVSGVLVLVMIVALSHPFRGDFRITSEPFEAALSRMDER